MSASDTMSDGGVQRSCEKSMKLDAKRQSKKGWTPYRVGGGVMTGARTRCMSRRFVLPPHSGDGGSAFGPTHGSRYVHVATGTIMLAVSAALFQPLPAETVLAAPVGAGADSVGTAPVGV